jgi:hypothetical protein
MLIPREQIDRAKELLPIPVLWRLLNLPGEPGKTGKACHSPFRKDRHPSFAIYDDGKTAFDFTTGKKYDSPQFFAEARGLPIGQALKEFVELAGGDASRCENVSPRKRTDPECRGEVVQRKPDLSRLRTPSKAELHAIARDRGLAFAAPLIAAKLHCLKVGDVCGFHSWILTDPFGRLAEARRFGALLFPACGELCERKAHTIRGSTKSWPLGLGVDRSLVEKAALIVVAEGGLDWLALWDFVYRAKRWDVLPITILGRCVHGLRCEALELLKGKRVRFFPHVDQDRGGLDQVSLIHEQLRTIGCEVSYFDFSGLFGREGIPIKDLNDVAHLNPSQFKDLFYDEK